MKHPPAPPDLETIYSAHEKSITQAVANNAYRTYVQTAQNQYEHWEKTRYRAKGKKLDPNAVWFMIAMQRQLNRQTLPLLVDKDDHPLQFWLTDESQRQLLLIDQELAGRLSSFSSTRLTKEQKEKYIVNSLMEEAIASSLLEGAPTTRKEAKQMLRNQRRPKTIGEQMVVNNYHAMMFIKEHLNDNLTTDLIHELHRIVCEKTMPDDQIGRWRKTEDNVAVVDSRDDEIMHTPPDSDQLDKRMRRLFRFANKFWNQSTPFIHPIVQAIAIHFQFAYEHPYCDGNGRVARALFYWSTMRHRYWLFEFMPLSTKIRKSAIRYGKAFVYTEQDHFDLGYFLAYHLRVIQLARKDLHDYLEKQMTRQHEASKLQQQDGRLNPRQTLIMHFLRHEGHSEISIAEHQSRQAISYPTARSDLLQLNEWGYLTMRKKGKKQIFMLNES